MPLDFYIQCSSKESACQCRRCKRHPFDPWVRKITWRKKWQPTPVFLPRESHGQKSLVSYSPWGHKESDTTEWLSTHPRWQGISQDLRAPDCPVEPPQPPHPTPHPSLGYLTLLAGLISNRCANVCKMPRLCLCMERFNKPFSTFQPHVINVTSPSKVKENKVTRPLLPTTTFFPDCKINLDITGH